MLNKIVFFLAFLLSFNSFSIVEIELHYPDMVIEGVETNLTVSSTEELPAEIELNGELVSIEYSDGGLVYVPVGRFNRVHKYIGTGGGSPPLSAAP